MVKENTIFLTNSKENNLFNQKLIKFTSKLFFKIVPPMWARSKTDILKLIYEW